MNKASQWLVPGLLLVLFALSRCTESNDKKTGLSGDASKNFTLVSPDYSGIDFANQVKETPDRSVYHFDYFYNGAGLAIGDLNNDGLPDIFFAGNDVPNRLYLNKGDLRFEDISEQAGIQSKRWSTGVTLADVNEDGWLDIYVCNSGPNFTGDATRNELYINNKNNTFTEAAAQYGIADPGRSTQATFFDMDKDGDLDLWVMNHSLRLRGDSYENWQAELAKLAPKEKKRESSALYRNDGNGRFTDVSAAAGIEKVGFGLGIAVNDFDENGFLDVYVANDFFIPDFMFMNNGDGTFSDGLRDRQKHIPYYAMGCDVADFNNDGLSDLVVVDMTPSDHVRNKVLMASMDVMAFRYLTEYRGFTPQYMLNSLYVNNGYGSMSDIGLFAGVSQTDWSWAVLFSDLDNDGLKDIIVTNGFRKDTKDNDWRNALTRIQEEKGEAYGPKDFYEHLAKATTSPVPNQVFQNKDGLSFSPVSDEWGFEAPSFSNGAAYADLDQDGDLDLVINNFDQPAFLYRNNSEARSKNHFIRFKLKDGAGVSTAMHAQVYIYQGDQQQRGDYAFTRGYQSYVEPAVHFGLGENAKVDRVEVRWLDGMKTVIENPEADKVHVIDKQKTKATPYIKPEKAYDFANITGQYFQPVFAHRENSYDDFEKEVLLPHRQSMLGPALAVADVNGDGREDVFVGGAKDQVGQLYLQTSGGPLKAHLTFEADKAFEDVGAAFFDADSDGDQDLYIGSGGGGDFAAQDKLLQDRLYLNDGLGNFSRSKAGLPKMTSSTKTIAPADWDGDGDLDLFVGGRTMPGKYPLAPRSYLLRNDNGKFTDQTASLAAELAKVGMVTDAQWTDLNADGKPDLMLVGEWLPITAWKNMGDGFEDVTESMGFGKTAGWWCSLRKADIDNDGDEDLIAGNIGLNNKFHPSEKKPLYVYANDFDKNGSLDIVLSKIYKDNKVPVRGRECSSTQMPFITEKFPTYSAFANASLEEIYDPGELQEAVHYTVYSFASVFIENKGGGVYEVRELPKEAQISPINGTVAADFNKDGNMDLILAGNMFQTEVETPAYDAGKGLYFKGKGKGEFETSLRLEFSGLFLHQDVKDICLIHLGPQKVPAILVANNNGALELFAYNLN